MLYNAFLPIRLFTCFSLITVPYWGRHKNTRNMFVCTTLQCFFFFNEKTVVVFSTYNMHAEYVIIVCLFESAFFLPWQLLAISASNGSFIYVLHWFIHVMSIYSWLTEMPPSSTCVVRSRGWGMITMPWNNMGVETTFVFRASLSLTYSLTRSRIPHPRW